MEGGGSVTTKRAEAKPDTMPFGATSSGKPLSLAEGANRAVGDGPHAGRAPNGSARRKVTSPSMGAVQLRGSPGEVDPVSDGFLTE